MKIEECIAILENIRENISSDGEISVGLSITALTDAICYAQTCKNQTAHLHKTKRGSIWLIGCLTQNLANKLDFYYSFSENGCNYYSRCLKDNNHREFVIVDDYEVSWLDQRNKQKG